MIDDSELFHGAYDPVKAREYYLRTRKLKGRKKATPKSTSTSGSVGLKVGKTAAPKVASKRLKAKRRRAELLRQQKVLRKRLERLRVVLRQLVEEAESTSKKNSSPNAKKNERKTESRSKTSSSSSSSKDRKSLTASQKAEKAKKAKEEYEKEKPISLSKDVEILKKQVKDIRAKIDKAMKESRDRQKKAGSATIKLG